MSRPLLDIPRSVYTELMGTLACSGRGVKEAGAFLLGQERDRMRYVTSYLMYDQVAAESSREHAYVSLTAQEMARAWDFCYRAGLKVVGDVHTHPAGAAQSASDRKHPMVAVAGHVALIVPWFALRRTQPADIGVHLFLGNETWHSMFGVDAQSAIQLS